MIALNIDLEIWPTPPLIFTQGSKSAKIGLDSQNQSPLTGSSFETEQHIGNLKHVSGASMISSKYRLKNLANPSSNFYTGG